MNERKFVLEIDAYDRIAFNNVYLFEVLLSQARYAPIVSEIIQCHAYMNPEMSMKYASVLLKYIEMIPLEGSEYIFQAIEDFLSIADSVQAFRVEEIFRSPGGFIDVIHKMQVRLLQMAAHTLSFSFLIIYIYSS
jgi:hypothetical protein